MSLSQFGFGIAVFAVPDYMVKLRRLLANPAALAWLGLYVLFLVGGFASEDISYFLKEIRTKMPIWVMPAALALMPALTEKQRSLVLHFFVAGCLVATGAGMLKLFSDSVVDRRDLSPLVSHIRLGLYIVLSLFVLLFMMLRQNKHWRLFSTAVYGVVFVLLLFWLFYLKSFTGVVLFALVFPATLFFLLLYRVISWAKKMVVAVAFILPFFATVGYVSKTVLSFYEITVPDFSQLPTHTSKGNPYIHDSTLFATENGNRIWIYLEFDEMRETWNARSSVKYDSLDKKGNRLSATLIRYLASKKLPRDAEGVAALSSEEVIHIENGIPNYLYTSPFNIKGRIYETLWELDVYAGSGDPKGKSMSTRIELWKAGISAVARSPISGYGTGDVRHVLENELNALGSYLDYYGQFGPHNQYLAVALAIGLPGVLWMLLAFLMPFFYGRYKPSFLFYVMLALLLLSAMNEDLFETQASVTFFAFFYHFLLESPKEIQNRIREPHVLTERQESPTGEIDK